MNLGTNGGTAWSWSTSVPPDSDTVLVTHRDYNAAGYVLDTVDPRGIMAATFYDMLGRQTETIAAWDGTGPSPIETSDTNQVTENTYDGNGDVLTMTAVMPSGTNSQTTAYLYGVGGTAGTNLFSNDPLSTVEFPSASTGLASTAATDDQSFTYDRQGEKLTFTDQNGTIHAYGYDVLARLTSDTATTLGTGVNGTTRRLGYNFNDAGLPFQQTSYYNTTGTNVENQVEDVYNGYAQLITQYQAVAGSVNTTSTPKVQYGFNTQTAGQNYSRQTTLTYPDLRVVNYNYNSGIDTTISRLSSMSDSGGNIESYNYLGLGTIVREIRPGSVLTYVKANGASNGDAGDIYTGLDRFGRVVDQLWSTSDSPLTAADSGSQTGDILGTTTDEFQYLYDQDSNVLYKNNMVHSADSELYHANGGGEATDYDPLNRLTAFSRGTLSASGTILDTVSSPSTTNSWSLDALGNSTNTGGTSRTFNSKNQIATYGGSSGITYDHDGNMTKDQAGNTYGFDAWNRLISVSLLGQSTTETYSYNAANERPGLTVNNCTGSVTSSYYSTQWQDLEDDIAPSGGGSTTTDTYLWSRAYIDELVARDQSVNGGTTRLYAQQDANHDITSLINTSARVVERFIYDPYGARTALTSAWATTSEFENWVYGFQGGRLDPLDGLVNFRNRDLNPTTGTWMEQDPAGYVDSISLYLFDDSSPVCHTDPGGLNPHVVLVRGDPFYTSGDTLGTPGGVFSHTELLHYHWVGFATNSSIYLSNLTSGSYGYWSMDYGTTSVDRHVKLYPLKTKRDGCPVWMIMAEITGGPENDDKIVSAAIGISKERTNDDTMTISATYASALTADGGKITVHGGIGDKVGVDVEIPFSANQKHSDTQEWTFQLEGE